MTTSKGLASRLYRGEAGVDVVGKRKIWYSVAGAILLLAILSFSIRGFTFGIEFSGGNGFSVPVAVDERPVGTLEEVEAAFTQAGAHVVTGQKVGNAEYLIRTGIFDEDANRDGERAAEVRAAAARTLGIDPDDISQNRVSSSWGAQITETAITGLIIFLIVVSIYLILAFREWRMAVGAFAALVQNLVLTAAVYSLVGFEVTPSTVIGFLTILGFALYDVVVVYDKVRENTRGITGSATTTYGEAANLAVNQTLMRSINTAVVALLPVGGLLFIGAGLLGAGTLKDLGLVLFVGMLAAVYSSIFFATPVLVDLKEQEPRYKLHKQRVLARRANGGVEPKTAPKPGARKAGAKATPAKAGAATAEAGDTVLAGSSGATPSNPPRPGARPGGQQRKRPSGAKPGGSRGGGRKR